jgi:DNA-binding beta-propeller fold protein YncE
MVSTVKIGIGRFTYQVEDAWEKLPPGYSWREVAAVAVDSKDQVYVFNRGDHPMIVFDREGNFLRSWGEGVFTRPHGLTLGPGDTLYCTDDGDHTIRQCTLDGEVLMTIGLPGQPAAYQSGEPFNRCTDVAIDPRTGDLYVSDGYGNSRVHKYTPNGRLLFSWGEPGTDPGEFNIVHNIATDAQGYLYVADRENHRVQVFDSRGRFETQWVNMHRPCAIYISQEQHVYIGELGAGMNVNRNLPNIGPRITVFNTSGDRLARIGHLGFGLEVGQFVAPHGISLDSKGDIYLAEVAWTNFKNLGEPKDSVRSLQKLVNAS